MKSMTGYGIGEAPLGQGKVTVEIRALNHRYLEVRTGLSGELAGYAHAMEQRARKRFSRGRYDISARATGVASLTPQLDVDRARAIYGALARLRDELAPGTELPMSAIAAIPDLFMPGAARCEECDGALFSALDAAVEQLEQMRDREGKAHARELGELLSSMRGHRSEAAERCATNAGRHLARLRERVTALLKDSGSKPNADRLENEVALLAERSDVAEELARIDSHSDQLENAFASDEPTGRRIDFLLQELSREVNTLSAKAQNATVSHLVVEMKTLIERMRQLAHNVL